ncbi:MAG: putative RND superfamily exporter protein [Flavobacteriales bacterium]|jgi:predicted RND superfamily exporter protein
MNQTPPNQAAKFFYWVTNRPKTFFALGLISIAICLTFFTQLKIDPRAESFLPADSAALLYREKVEDIFGLTDPMVIAIKSNHADGVFNPTTLALVQWLTDQVHEIPGIDTDRIISLATEDDIYGTQDGMMVEPFFDDVPKTQHAALVVRDKVMDFPLYVGSLVSRDTSMTLIVTEIKNEEDAPNVYSTLLNLVENAPVAEGDSLHVAGDGAVSGYLVTYINADASRLVPISVIIITLLCLLAFRTMQGVSLPGLVIGASTASAIGIMAAFGDPIYVITTSMPILLVGVAVADSIHILSEYYEQKVRTPTATQQQLVVTSLTRMWRPVLLTTVTSMIGFFGVYVSSYMPPMQSFGLYSMIGLGVAGIYSLIVLPAAQMFFTPKDSPVFITRAGKEKNDIFTKIMVQIGHVVLARPALILSIAFVILITGIVGALKLEVNESWIDNFRSSEKIHIANNTINNSMDGSSNLDIVIETPNPEDLFKPRNLKKIEELQNHLARHKRVGGTTSIVDYIKQMNRSLNQNDISAYTIPTSANLISQYFLLYSASGDPSEFEEEIDYDYRMALVRARLNSGRFQDFKHIVEGTQTYLNEEFNSAEIKGSLSGRIYVDYEWLENLLGTHYKGVLFALILVWLVACLSFKSVYGGTLALIPVLFSTLAVYALMGITGITLAVGTTMTAAIALGIGIDFSIHTLDKIKLLIKDLGHPPEEALLMLFPSTGRALLFNFLAVFIGFGILGLSYVPPLSKLGILVAFAVLISFISSMTILPALIKILKPEFLGFTKD